MNLALALVTIVNVTTHEWKECIPKLPVPYLMLCLNEKENVKVETLYVEIRPPFAEAH